MSDDRVYFMSERTGWAHLYTVPATGGSGTITVGGAASDCPRSAASNAPWLTITGGASGIGESTVKRFLAAGAKVLSEKQVDEIFPNTWSNRPSRSADRQSSQPLAGRIAP